MWKVGKEKSETPHVLTQPKQKDKRVKNGCVKTPWAREKSKSIVISEACRSPTDFRIKPAADSGLFHTCIGGKCVAMGQKNPMKAMLSTGETRRREG